MTKNELDELASKLAKAIESLIKNRQFDVALILYGSLVQLLNIKEKNIGVESNLEKVGGVWSDALKVHYLAKTLLSEFEMPHYSDTEIVLQDSEIKKACQIIETHINCAIRKLEKEAKEANKKYVTRQNEYKIRDYIAETEKAMEVIKLLTNDPTFDRRKFLGEKYVGGEK
ncbi:MAG: hypothetical protein FWC26_00150 [Fibromonadales bacterium]|nr:hypothetical protein [Fibromonadales bacterium]